MKFLFLYTELAEYTMMCFREHVRQFPNDEFHIFHYPLNAEAPFKFQTSNEGIYLYKRELHGVENIYELIKGINPDCIFVSGWTDKIYRKITRIYKDSIPIMCCFDNVWKGTLKQRILLPVARWFLRRLFDGAWVPSSRQSEYALKLGFKEESIFQGFYCIDTDFYHNNYLKYKEEKEEKLPHRFLCVARYVPQKGLHALWEAFIQLKEETQNDWELWCAGTGLMFSMRTEHPAIRHLGFVQPSEMDYLIRNCAVFVLPSLSEPWGVVVHEFAAAGFPLVLSRHVGSGELFLDPGKNGLLFEPGDATSIKEALKAIISKSESDLRTMGEESAKMALKFTPANWSNILVRIVGQFQIGGKNQS